LSLQTQLETENAKSPRRTLTNRQKTRAKKEKKKKWIAPRRKNVFQKKKEIQKHCSSHAPNNSGTHSFQEHHRRELRKTKARIA